MAPKPSKTTKKLPLCLNAFPFSPNPESRIPNPVSLLPGAHLPPLSKNLPPIYRKRAQSPGHNKLSSLHSFHTCETTLGRRSSRRSHLPCRFCGGLGKRDNRNGRWTKGQEVIFGSRASSFQSQVTQPSAHLIEQHPRRDQRAPKRHGLKVGRPSKAAGLQAQLHSNPRGTRRDAVRKHSKPQPANPVRAAEWEKVARDPPSIIPRTRKESKSPANKHSRARERCVMPLIYRFIAFHFIAFSNPTNRSHAANNAS